MTFKGKFITFEGSEGCGKSTQSKFLVDHLTAKGFSVKLVREPGGVVISEKVREILLDKKNTRMNKECEKSWSLSCPGGRSWCVTGSWIQPLRTRGMDAGSLSRPLKPWGFLRPKGSCLT